MYYQITITDGLDRKFVMHVSASSAMEAADIFLNLLRSVYPVMDTQSLVPSWVFSEVADLYVC